MSKLVAARPLSPSLRALADLDAQRDRTEADLRQTVADLRQQNDRLSDLLAQAMALSERRILAIGLLLSHLQAQGMAREEIDRLTQGNLDLSEPSEGAER